MPRETINRYRLYCKQCNDFTLHERIFCDENTHPKFNQCNFYFSDEDKVLAETKFEFVKQKEYVSLCECGCQYTPVSINEIDVEKVKEQRKRFGEQRSEEFKRVMNTYLKHNSTLFNDIFKSPEIGYKVIESDAGLKHEEELERKAQGELKAKQYLELSTYKNVGRNDVCLCGSGLKYKKCCLNKHIKY